MIEKQYYKIYSIQIDTNQSTLVEIETIILRGLYKFSILGINQKNSSDMRDRIYSALRSQKLTNLKSDNKKITVNIIPNDVNTKGNIHDLGIALSCLVSMDQINLDDNTLIIGELSILGNIIPTGYLLKTIYQSIKNNIKTIICPYEDIKYIDLNQNNLHRLIEDNNIQFIAGNNLSDLIQNIKNKKYYTFAKIQSSRVDICSTSNVFVDISDRNIYKIILSLCTNRNVFIEARRDSYIKRFLKNLIYYTQKIDDYDMLKMSDILAVNDTCVLDRYSYPIISILNNQIDKNELNTVLKESLFGFNIIENFLSISEDNLYIIKKHHMSSILCFYNPCPCGNNGFFFNKHNQDRCYCLQRNIIRYQQKLYKLENNFFDIHINNIDDVYISYTADDYIKINNIINTFKKTNIETILDNEINSIVEKFSNIYERGELIKIITLTKDIKKLNFLTKKDSNLLISNKDVELAVEMIRRDS